MKLAISACTSGLAAEVDRRFGRAPWFMFYDLDTDAEESVENEGCDGREGVGVSTAQAVVDRGADVVLTGDCGPKARTVLDAAGVRVVTGVGGQVREAVEAFRSGSLSTDRTSPTGRRGGGAGRGRGGSPERGMRGGGRGRGGGGGGRGRGGGGGGRGRGGGRRQ